MDIYKYQKQLKNGGSERRIVALCNQGRLKGTVKFGNTWVIPEGTEKPKDERIKSGKYIKTDKITGYS